MFAALAGCGFAPEPVSPPVPPPPAPLEPLPPPPPPPPLCFAQTGAMQETRIWPGAALLEDGRVLVVGGSDGSEPLRSAELYDPAAGTWAPAAPMRELRIAPAVVRLLDGRILVAGGWARLSSVWGVTSIHATAELFDPATGTWSAAAPMLHERSSHTGLRLADGRVLVSFGVSRGNRNSLELYDPALDAWTELLDPPWMGVLAGAPALLPDGRPFFASGLVSATYDPATGAWQEAAYKQGPGIQRLWAFPDGSVLSPSSFPDGAGELYSPATDSWTRAAGFREPRRESAAFAQLQDGRLLLAGGSDSAYEPPLTGAELFDPATATWTYAGTMAQGRQGHVLVTLRDGRVLAVGGRVTTAELFDPACPGRR